MRPWFNLALVLFLGWSNGADAQEIQRYRQWIEGTETGGMERIVTQQPERIIHREWTQLERLGSTVRQELVLTATRAQEGSLHLTWSVRLSDEPMKGEADWSPGAPGSLRVTTSGGTPTVLMIPPGAYLWPGDSDNALREAARNSAPLRYTEFSPGTQQWTEVELQPVGAEPLPGFPDTVRFHGRGLEGPTTAALDTWISPRYGEVKQVARMAGLTILLQRAELPAPSSPQTSSGFFQRTLASLPPHPLLLWMSEATLRWKGPGRQELPQDAQQMRLGENLYRVRIAAQPNTEEAAALPVKGPASAEEAPFLASSPLLQFGDPAFSGLVARLNPPPGATRWELAQRVTSFVFEWITVKDMSVGFASALEVARQGKGDCTEHGVLAVALLRKLGVPARGVVGWAGLGEVTGLHFWVEVKLGSRWVPVDPTFDQAPASALRLKLGTTDLADLGSIGWDTTTLSVLDGAWVPEKPWTEAIRLEGDTLRAPDGMELRAPGGRWALKEGRLHLRQAATHACSAVPRPTPQQVKGASLLLGSISGKRGWFHPGNRILWMDLGHGRWLQVDRMQEALAFRFLDLLEIRP